LTSNSGTSAILLALKAINLQKNDIVIVPAINFIAAANLSKILGAKVYFSDVDKFTGQMTPTNLLDCIKLNKIKKVKVFFIMHNGGFNNFAKEFYKIKKKLKCLIIEDACHALGANNSRKKNDLVGNCKYSDLTTFSFHPLKTITTGEGGMTTTNNLNFYNLMCQYRNHGFALKKKQKGYTREHKLNFCGYNFRLTDFQCYLGISQLKKINFFLKKRNDLAKYYFKKLNQFNDYIILPKKNKYYSAWHLFVVLFKLENLRVSRDKIIKILYKSGIKTQVHYVPNYRQKPFLKKNKKIFNGAEFYFSRCLSIPIYPELKFKQIDFIVKTIEKVIKSNKKIPKK
jgi:dTDP-4-amino-4,6-dideoxygalactose transaminase